MCCNTLRDKKAPEVIRGRFLQIGIASPLIHSFRHLEITGKRAFHLLERDGFDLAYPLRRYAELIGQIV